MDGVNISFNMLELVNDEEEERMVHHNRSQTGVKYVSNDNNSNNNNVNNYEIENLPFPKPNQIRSIAMQ